MTTFETLRIEVEGELGFLTLNRPERLNAMNGTMLAELAEAAYWFDQHLDIRVVIVRGEGRAFCAGADLKGAGTIGSPSAPPPASASWQARREAGQRGLRMTNAIEQMRAVTIAQIHGYAVGGGFLLAVSCDLRVAADDVVFFIPEVELGIPLTWGGVPRLVRELGPALAKELVMTCRRFGAQEAKEWRFLNRVVAPDRLDAEARALATSLLAMPAVPVVITKDQANAATEALAPARTAFLEGDALNGVSADEGSQVARERYAAGALGKGGRRDRS
jgi:enoyl-CoA hydratase/3-hydroxypropionyl-coenzyme A dehydratase